MDKEKLYSIVQKDLKNLEQTNKRASYLEDFTDIYNNWMEIMYNLALEGKLDYKETLEDLNEKLFQVVQRKIYLKQGHYAGTYAYLMAYLRDYTNNNYLRYCIYVFCYYAKGKYILNEDTTKRDINNFNNFMDFTYENNKKLYREFPDTDRWSSEEILQEFYTK